MKIWSFLSVCIVFVVLQGCSVFEYGPYRTVTTSEGNVEVPYAPSITNRELSLGELELDADQVVLSVDQVFDAHVQLSEKLRVERHYQYYYRDGELVGFRSVGFIRVRECSESCFKQAQSRRWKETSYELKPLSVEPVHRRWNEAPSGAEVRVLHGGREVQRGHLSDDASVVLEVTPLVQTLPRPPGNLSLKLEVKPDGAAHWYPLAVELHSDQLWPLWSGVQGERVVNHRLYHYQLQRRMAALGFDPGPADGILGPATQVAVDLHGLVCGRELSGQAGSEAYLKSILRTESCNYFDALPTDASNEAPTAELLKFMREGYYLSKQGYKALGRSASGRYEASSDADAVRERWEREYQGPIRIESSSP